MTLSISTIYQILQLVFLIPVVFAVAYIFIFSVSGLFYKQNKDSKNKSVKKIAVLIPGYKEDEVIVDVVKEALNQNYPKVAFDIIVIADSFLPETVDMLKSLPVKVIEVSFEKSTKSKALNKAMAQLPDIYDIAVVLDADNVMAFDFLEKINSAFISDIKAVQGHRTAKNLNNGLAILDAISEEINNHIFRKGHRAIGLSSAIIGSGMAFDYQYFKNLMSTVKAIGGFDKEIELKMLREGHTIEYLDDAYVFDEKVQKADVFTNQRRRWLSAQFHYFKQDIGRSVYHLFFKGNVDYFDKAIQFIQPPRILLLGLTLISGLFFLILNSILPISQYLSLAWLITMVLCLLTFFFSIPGKFYNFQTMKALTELPKGMLLMLGSLLRIKGANKQFLHTKHTSISVKNNNK